MTDLRKESPSKEQMEEYWRKARECSSVEEILSKNGPLAFLFKDTVETMLKEEMTDHLGYGHNDARAKNTENSRNGHYSKKLKTDDGEVEIQVPRDRKGEFSPKVLPKYKTKTSGLEKRIIGMYAKGMTTTDIASELSEIYMGVDVSPTFISQVTEKILTLAKEWQSRQLDEVYPVIFFDAIHYKVREEGRVITKAVYVALAINLEGKREILGFYIGESESSKFWLQLFTDLSCRGVKDILIASVDGLKGLPDAIKSVFPKANIQLCVVHQIRNSLRYVAHKNKKEFASDLKLIYKASSEEAARSALEELDKKWGKKYPIVIKSWRKNWENLATFFEYSPEIRKMIYTTNIIEGFHRQLRKVSKNRGVFPNDDSLLKLLYLATMDASKKWTMPKHGWPEMISQLAIHFEGRISLALSI